MKRALLILMVVALVIGVMAPPVSADPSTLVSADLNTPGDNLLAIDTATELAWLDLTWRWSS